MKNSSSLNYSLELSITSMEDGCYLSQAKYSSDLLIMYVLEIVKLFLFFLSYNETLTSKDEKLVDDLIFIVVWCVH